MNVRHAVQAPCRTMQRVSIPPSFPCVVVSHQLRHAAQRRQVEDGAPVLISGGVQQGRGEGGWVRILKQPLKDLVR